MKRTAFVLILILMCIGTNAFAQENTRVFVNSEQLETDIPPVIINNRTMLPMRAIFEKLGAQVDWIEEDRIIIAYNGSKFVSVMIGSEIMLVQDMAKSASSERIVLDSPPVITDGTTLVPVRAVSEAFGAKVSWDAEQNSVYIAVASDWEETE